MEQRFGRGRLVWGQGIVCQMRVYLGATLRIQLSDLYMATMRPYNKLV